jgi:hypothetical protein
MKIATNAFTQQDVQRLCNALDNLYGIKASVHSAGYENQYNVYIHVEFMPPGVSISTLIAGNWTLVR